MSDCKIKTGVVFVRNGLWQVEVEKREHMIADQWPNHAELLFGLHENCRIKVEILNSTNARFLEFLGRNHDAKIKTGVILVRNGLWHVEVEKHVYVMVSPGPHEIKLLFGRDENRRVKVEILNSTNARFLEFTKGKS